MVSVDDMRQWIGSQRVSELGGGCDKPLEGRPATRVLDGLIKRGTIFMRFQQR